MKPLDLKELDEALARVCPNLFKSGAHRMSMLNTAAVILFENDTCNSPDACLIRQALINLNECGSISGEVLGE